MDNINVEVSETKVCKICALFKNLDEFDRQKGAKDGRKPWCKLCCQEKNRKRYLDNREKIIGQVKDWQKEQKTKEYSPVQNVVTNPIINQIINPSDTFST